MLILMAAIEISTSRFSFVCFLVLFFWGTTELFEYFERFVAWCAKNWMNLLFAQTNHVY